VTAVDDNLADVVLLSQNEIEKFRSEIRQLRLEVDDLQSRIEITAEEDRRRMAKEHAVAEENMNITVKGWQKRCEEIQREKGSMEKEYENLLKMMETNHLKAVEELETLYDKKLAYENEKYLQIEQELIEEENKHTKKEKKVKSQHTETIGRLEHQYRDEFSKTQKIFETNKNTAEQIKTEYDEKLKEIEDEHEAEIRDLNNQHKKEIGKLDEEIMHLTEANTKYRREYKETKDEREGLKKSEEEKENDIKQLKLNLNEAFMTIDANRKKLEDLKNTVEEKKKKIGRYKYKVTDLQKSKHVLSYRTTEMRKNLEPKEAQIDKLKDELFKLEKEFESMLKTSQVQNDKLVKEEKKIEALQAEIDTKNTAIAKKEMLIHKIKMDIYTAIRTKEPKEYPNEMKKLFRDYCSDNEIKEGSAHDPRSIEEMVRQIQHLEKSIYQINRGTEKTVKRREQDIHRKTLENSDLICDLNDLRKNNKKLESDIYNITKENDELKREKKVLTDDRTKLRNVLTRLNNQSSRGNFLPQLQTTHQSDGQIPPLLKARIDQAAGVSKTRFGKGAMNDLKSQSVNDKNRLVELMAEIDICNQRLMQQESEFNVLADKLRRSGANDEMTIQYEDPGQSINVENHHPSSGQLGQSHPTSDRFQGMKSGLQVRSTLMKMSQHD